MRPIWFVLFFFTPQLIANTKWSKVGHKQNQPQMECQIRVDFDSYAGGIDAIAYEAAKNFLTNEATVKKVTEWQSGREGETALCIELNEKTTIEKTYEALSAVIHNAAQANPPGGIQIRAKGKTPRTLNQHR